MAVKAMRIQRLTKDAKENLLEDLLKRSPNNYGQYEQGVQEILAHVKEEKDQAVFAYTKKFDHADITADNIKVTEEEIEERQASLMVDRITIDTVADKELLVRFETVKEVISNIRSIRLQKNIAQKEALELQVIGENPVAAFNAVVMKMCNLSSVNVVENKADGAASFMVGTTEYAVPLGNMIDVEAEIARMEAELKHKEGFLQGVLKKLGNEKFVNNAPATVLEMERKKQADAESIIKSLKESIAALKKA